MHVIKPPTPLPTALTGPAVFLAGSIEMGRAIDWQAAVTAQLADLEVTVLNPRRDAWDASWTQSITNPVFRAQVEWELDALDRAAVIAMYLDPDTRAPISLLELGLHAAAGKLVICCPDGYWRKGNVEVVAARYGLPLVDDLAALVAALRRRLGAPEGAR